jgi:hypothetical protein
MSIQTIKLTTYEYKVLDFWKAKVNPISVEKLYGLLEEHGEHAAEAGPYADLCVYTVEMLARLEAEIEDRLHTILERYADWASD